MFDWQKIKGLKEQRGAKVAEMTALLEKADAEKRELSAEEIAKFDGTKKEVENLRAQIERVEQAKALDEQARAANDPTKVGRDAIERRGDDPDRPLSETRAIDGFAVKDLRRYSLLRAMHQMASRQPLDGVEKEISDELAKRSEKPPQGFFFPNEIPTGADFKRAEQRSLNAGTTGTGAIATMLDVSNFIELLRNRIVCQAMGARMITGLVGNLALPKQTAAATAGWVADEAAATASNQTIGQVTFAPNTLSAWTDLSRKFLLQSSVSAEQFVRDDLARVMAIEIDRAALNGSGTSNQPTGILQTGSINTVAVGTNGGVPTWNNIVQMESNVATQNADIGKLAYCTNPKVRGLFKSTLKNAVAGALYFWSDDAAAPVNNYACGVTNQLPSNLVKGTSGAVCSPLIFGNWDSLVMGFWGMLDILVDPYSNSTTGSVRIRALQDADIKLRHVESFSVCVDIIAP